MYCVSKNLKQISCDSLVLSNFYFADAMYNPCMDVRFCLFRTVVCETTTLLSQTERDKVAQYARKMPIALCMFVPFDYNQENTTLS